MKMIKTYASTNGRWGVQVTCPDATEFPVRGNVKSLGTLGGFKCFEVISDESAETFVIIEGEAEALVGCSIVVTEGLQSNNDVTILLALPGAIWNSWGYKRRSVHFRTVTAEGQIESVPEAALLSLGLVEPKEAPTPVEQPPDDAIERTTVLLALQKAGLAK